MSRWNVAPFVFAGTLVGCASSSGGAPPPNGTGGAGGSGGASACAAITRPALPDSHLAADGTKLRDALGRQVFLRGVNAGGRAKFQPFAPFDFDPASATSYQAALEAYFDRAAGWGIDVVRAPLTWEAIEPTEGVYDEGFLARYDALIDAANKRGISVLVDLHQDVYAQSYCGDGFPPWTIPAPIPASHHDCTSWFLEYFSDKGVRAAFDRFWANGGGIRDAAGKLWDMLAARYGNRPGVIGFDVFNEPSSGTADGPTFEMTTLVTYYTEIGSRLRAAAPKTLVFVEPIPDGLSNGPRSLPLPSGGNIVFAPHYYSLTAFIAKSAPAIDPVDPALKALAAQGDAWSAPVFVGELGITHDAADSTPYVSAHFDAFDAYQMSGTIWEYSTASEGWNKETLGLVSADGTEYSALVDGIVRAYPRAIAGSTSKFHYDAEAKTLALSYKPLPGGGVTEIAAPTRLYPAGVRVDVQAGCADTQTSGIVLVQDDGSGRDVTVTVSAK